MKVVVGRGGDHQDEGRLCRDDRVVWEDTFNDRVSRKEWARRRLNGHGVKCCFVGMFDD